MRFLLNPARQSARVVRKDPRRKNDAKTSLTRIVSSNNNNSTYIKSWGQQCSPNCGCVVRFETHIDPTTQTIINSNYHAKSLIAIRENGKLQPVYTTRNDKPMFQDCKCKTVHTLAKKIISFLPNKKVDRIRNMTEFSCTRSSTAFRHTVLADNRLPRTDTHCFDLLEEAFTAMIKGTMLKRRRNDKSFEKILVTDYVMNPPVDHAEMDGSRKELGMDRTKLSMSSPKYMSTLSMFDINAEHWESEDHKKQDLRTIQAQLMKKFDWVSYVDEQHQNEKSA